MIPISTGRTAAPLLARLDARDRALFQRLAMAQAPTPALALAWWRCVTHLGGAAFTIAVALGAALLAHGPWQRGGRYAALYLLISHLVVQLVKRSVGRPRPAPHDRSLITQPDRFSFPSGHATAASAIALGFALTVPAAWPVAAGLAMLVGISRVVLGVHYPGDVLAGQLIACLTALALPHPR